MAALALHKPGSPAVSRNTIELLIDLVEIKLGCVEIYDRDDARELRALERAKAELAALLGRKSAAALPIGLGRPGRRPAFA